MLFLRPYIIKNKVYKDIDKGAWKTVNDDFSKLNDTEKDSIVDNLDTYAACICEDYKSGSLDYNKAIAALDTINTLDESGLIYKKYASYLNETELVNVMNELQKAELNMDSSKIYECQDILNKLVLRMDNVTREQILSSMLFEKYKTYLDNKINANDIIAYAGLVSGVSYYSAYELSQKIQSNVAAVEWYRMAYDKADELATTNNYIEALKLIDKIQLDEADELYKNKFDTLYKNTFGLGKIYYESLFEKYSVNHDNASAIALLAEIADIYGDSFDMDSLQAQVASDWQNKYIGFVSDWDANLKKDLADSETGQYIIENKLDSIWPDSLCMYDVDDNGVPEMFLFNSERINDDYVECFMYHYNGSTCEYLGYVNVISFCVNSNILTFPKAFDRATGEEYALTAYDGDIIGTMTYCQEIDGEYFVDGEDATDYDYLVTKSDILQYQGRYNIANVGHSGLDEARSFILTYK